MSPEASKSEPRNSNQAVKSLRDFVGRLLMTPWRGAETPIQMPAPQLVLRVAVAGHLQIESPASLQHALTAILSGIKQYALDINKEYNQELGDREDPAAGAPPELRLLCQLAQGVDQMAAETALALGYSLHAVLPGARRAVETDIRLHDRANPNQSQPPVDAVRMYNELLGKAERVLQLDQPNGNVAELTTESYAQASSVILDHSDIVIVVVHERGTDNAGGTKWVERRAEDLGLPLIRIPMDRPSSAVVMWTTEDRRENRSLFNAASEGLNPRIFEPALNGLILNASSFPYQSGWFERRMINQLDPAFNSKFWDQRWKLPGIDTSLADHSLGEVVNEIDRDLKPIKVWADHRASGMANIVRGSFILCSMLGALAVSGAVVGVLVPGFGKAGKIVELICLLIILIFIWRSVKLNWRDQWLSLRQIERSVEQAAWLLTVGRGAHFEIPAYANKPQDDKPSTWGQWYLRAALRRASFPTAKLDSDYLSTVQTLVSHNLVKNQINYFESEAETYSRTDDALQVWIKRCIFMALAVTSLYLAGTSLKPWLIQFHAIQVSMQWIFMYAPPPKAIATTVGALMPAVAGALAAVKGYGEYGQIAGRYGGMARALKLLDLQIARRMPDVRAGAKPLGSKELTEILLAATSSLFQEVVSWQSLLRAKEIEGV